MTRATFFKHFELLADQSDAVAKMRELVVQLAVSGRLVSQKPSEKKITLAPLKLPPVETSDLAFKVPSNWTATRLGEVLTLEYGDSLPAPKRNDAGSYPVYGSNGIVGRHDQYVVEKPAIIVGRKGSSGALNLSDGPCWPTDVSYYVVPPDFADLRFTFFLLKSLRLESLGKGIKPGLNRNEAYQLPMALPPLAEQRRIVAKVDELMALCDELEQRQQARQHASGILQQSALHHLLAARQPQTFAAAWQRVRDHFHLLHDTPDAIPQLRRLVLSLAVRGYLVPQDAKEESASKLLGRVRLEKSQKVKLGEIRKPRQNEDAFVADDSVPIPNGWAWGCVADFGAAENNAIVDGPFGSNMKVSDYVSDGIYPVITIGNIDEGFDLSALRKISEEKFQELKRSSVRAGDILVAKIGSSYGKVGLYPAHMPVGIIPANLLKVTPNPAMNWHYLCHALRSQDFRDHLEKIVQFTAQPAFNVSKFKLLPVPIPPLAEQKRIVARVEELLRWCDTLEAQLHQTRTLGAHLLASTLHHLLAA